MACAETKKGSLLIKYRAGDTINDRPIEPCTNFWSSPDLWLVGGPNQTTAKEGVAHTIMARVTNGGPQPLEDVNVEVWVCDYTAGPLPTGQLNPPGRVTGFFAGPLAPNASTNITCAPTWTPTAAQVAINNGHVCLAANCWADTPIDGAELPSGGTIMVCCDTHHAQRNIGIVAANAGNQAKQSMNLQVAKEGGPQVFLIEMFPVFGRAVFGRSERSLIRSSEWAELYPSRSRFRPRDFGFTGNDIKLTQRAEVEVRPGEERRIDLLVGIDKRERPNTFHIFDVVTRDAKTLDVVGGARLLVLAVG